MAQDKLTIEQELVGAGIAVLRLAGNVSAGTFDELEIAIQQAFEQGCYKIIIDLSLVGYISSSAAGVFMNSLSQAQEHQGDIVLLSPTENVREILDLLNLSSIFHMAGDRETALASF